MSSVYAINKGVSKPIEFRGLKAQYIGYLAGGLVGLLLLFAILYLLCTPVLVCLVLILSLGGLLFSTVFRLSKKYGQYGLMKWRARKQVPNVLSFRSRKMFTGLWKGGRHGL